MEKDHLNLLCNVGELTSALAGSSDLDGFLHQIVRIVLNHIRADVCSIYLLDDERGELYMKETEGLNAEAMAGVRLKIGEGLVGGCLQDGRPICEDKASSNPRFKAFDQLHESEFESFLAVPIQRGSEKIGVLVLQRKERDNFDEHDILALQATASQLATWLENARILLAFRGPESEVGDARTQETIILRGQVASRGFALGEAMRMDRADDEWLLTPPAAQQHTAEDFHRAIGDTEKQIVDLEARLETRLPEMASMIFGAHQMMLRDPEFTGAMESLIKDGASADQAIRTICEKYITVFESSPNIYIREKVADVKDLGRRLMANLLRKDVDACADCEGKIIIADDLYPSDLLMLSSENVGGIVLANGGATSHIAILARSMKIPMVISPDWRLSRIKHETQVLVDAEVGTVFIHPNDELIEGFRDRDQRRETTTTLELKDETLTRCGCRVVLQANINLLSDITQAKELKAEGVGLYRTEFPFLIRTDFPSETDQIGIYHHLIESMDGREVTLRTLDVGGDKALGYFHDMRGEENPVLGLRSIRFSMAYPDIFKEQIRAILRAADGHPGARIMFPMISGYEEFIQARDIVRECIDDMKASHIPHLSNPGIGMMVEVPSVIEVINELAEQADFFCIGTNDFTQFMLAVDRNNERVQSYFAPAHPAVLRALARVARAAGEKGIDVSVCGEMAHEIRFVPFLLGVGIRKLSADSQYLPALQEFIQRIEIAECEALADDLLKLRSCDAIDQRIDVFLDLD